MSRYYSIELTKNADGKGSDRTFTSYPNGQNDPNALNVELDISTLAFAAPAGDSGQYVRVWGISLQDIAQARDFNGSAIKVSGGMQKGLPLANPQQAGLIVQGFVWQCFGNWVGVNMTLDFIIKVVPPILPNEPAGVATAGTTARNIVCNWKTDTPMSDAITQALKTAYPDFTTEITISDKLKRKDDQIGHYTDITSFAQYIKQMSKAIIGGADYAGVDIFPKGKTFFVSDGTGKGQSQSNPTKIVFTDLVGQVTWVGFSQVQVTCVMRHDIGFNDYITLPPGQITTTEQSLSQFRNGSIFQGTFRVIGVRHVGNFRSPEGEAWVTTIDAILQPASSSGGSGNGGQ